jgi:hypothetical protein
MRPDTPYYLSVFANAGCVRLCYRDRSSNSMSSSEIEAEIRALVTETNAPKSADELLAAYAGRETELLKNLRKLKAKTDKEAAMIAEIRTLAEETNASKSADEMLELYKGREQELLNNLRKLYAQKQVCSLGTLMFITRTYDRSCHLTYSCPSMLTLFTA